MLKYKDLKKIYVDNFEIPSLLSLIDNEEYIELKDEDFHCMVEQLVGEFIENES